MILNKPYQDRRTCRCYRVKSVGKLTVTLRPVCGGGRVVVSTKQLAKRFIALPEKQEQSV
jgi:hypothetical protein